MHAAQNSLYKPFAAACVVHGLAFSAVLLFGITHTVVISNVSRMMRWVENLCSILLFSWPTWVFVLWWFSKSWRYALLPIGLSLLGLAPGLFILLFLSSIGHT